MIAIFPEIAACAAKGEVESLAILVRRYFGGEETYAPKPSLEALTWRFGLTLKRTALPMHGALLAKDERGTFTIVMVVAQKSEALSERFLLAHMLGHYLLDVQPLIARGDWQVSGYQELLHPVARYSRVGPAGDSEPRLQAAELRADQFAAALLMPRGMVRKALDKLRDPAKVAGFFGVSLACLTRRLDDLGRPSAGPVDFFDAEGQIGRTPEANAAEAQDSPEARLTAPSDGSMPRSYAASTYGATEKATRRPTPAPSRPLPAAAHSSHPSTSPSTSPSTTPSAAAGAPAASSGMERLRQLARDLDKGPKAKP